MQYIFSVMFRHFRPAFLPFPAPRVLLELDHLHKELYHCFTRSHCHMTWYLVSQLFGDLIQWYILLIKVSQYQAVKRRKKNGKLMCGF